MPMLRHFSPVFLMLFAADGAALVAARHSAILHYACTSCLFSICHTRRRDELRHIGYGAHFDAEAIRAHAGAPKIAPMMRRRSTRSGAAR